MTRATVALLALLVCLPLMPAQAGSPGGLVLIALPTSKAVPFAAAVDAFFSRVGHDPKAGQCDNAMLTVDYVQHQKSAGRAPASAITDRMALEAVFGKSKRRQLSRALQKFRGSEVERGFDGALVYDVSGSDVVWYGLSADPDDRVFTARVPLADVGDKDKVSAALCHVLVHVPVQAAP